MKRKACQLSDPLKTKKQRTRPYLKRKTKEVQLNKIIKTTAKKNQNDANEKSTPMEMTMDIWIHCVSKYLDEKSFVNLFTISMTFYQHFLTCVKERAEHLCNNLSLLCFRTGKFVENGGPDNRICKYYMCFPSYDCNLHFWNIIQSKLNCHPISTNVKFLKPVFCDTCKTKTLCSDDEKDVFKMCSPKVSYLISRLSAFKGSFTKRCSRRKQNQLAGNIESIWCDNKYKLGYLYRYLVYLSYFDIKELNLPRLKNIGQKSSCNIDECSICSQNNKIT